MNHGRDLDAYLGEHIRDALAHDHEVGELDIHVSVTDTQIVLTGNVADRERLRAIDTQMAELDLGSHTVSNCLSVMDYDEPHDPEMLA